MSDRRKMFNGERLGRWTVIQAYTDRAGWCIALCDCGRVAPHHRGMLRRRAAHALVECNACASKRKALPIGHRVNGRTLIGRKPNGSHIVQCDACGSVKVSASSAPGGCLGCRRRRMKAPAHVLLATGVTRQGIDHRLGAGWTLEEATTLPKGMRPARLEARRAR